MKRWIQWTAVVMILCLFAPLAGAETPDLMTADGYVCDQAQIFQQADAQSVEACGQLLWDTYGVRALAVTVVGMDGKRMEEYLFDLKEAMDALRQEYALLVLSVSDQACGIALSERLSQEITPSKRDELAEGTMGEAYASGEISVGLRDTYLSLCDAVARACEARPDEKKESGDRWENWRVAAEMIADEATRLGKAVAESSVKLAEDLAQAGKSWWENVKILWNEK
ncbi:MAG TPA: TPM domain-containing protein [Clostridia bacterium]|nr:TPM domain-containing protein [Clostridia bacterium]